METIKELATNWKNDVYTRHIEVRPISDTELVVSLESDDHDNQWELEQIIEFV